MKLVLNKKKKKKQKFVSRTSVCTYTLHNNQRHCYLSHLSPGLLMEICSQSQNMASCAHTHTHTTLVPFPIIANLFLISNSYRHSRRAQYHGAPSISTPLMYICISITFSGIFEGQRREIERETRRKEEVSRSSRKRYPQVRFSNLNPYTLSTSPHHLYGVTNKIFGGLYLVYENENFGTIFLFCFFVKHIGVYRIYSVVQIAKVAQCLGGFSIFFYCLRV